MLHTSSTVSPRLATRFGGATRTLRSDRPLQEDQLRAVAPSIFATGKHVSRSERYTYIPTIEVLRGLSEEGFQVFMVAQGRSRVEGKSEYTKHLVRLRHAGDRAAARVGGEAHEIILINSHDGASSYQLLAGLFRQVCSNGLVVGEVVDDIRVRHTGQARDEVIEGVFRVLEQFETVDGSIDAMKRIELTAAEEKVFSTASLAMRYGLEDVGAGMTPISAEQVNIARRTEDNDASVWAALQRAQENLTKGGLAGRSPSGRRIRTRPLESIDRSVSLNQGLWVLAEEMRRLKAG